MFKVKIDLPHFSFPAGRLPNSDL